MSTETKEEEKKGLIEGIDENSMFNFDDDDAMNITDPDEDWMENLDGIQKTEEVKTEEPETKAETKEEDDDDLETIFDETTNSKTEELDLSSFNKMFNKNFKTQEELKAFMEEKDKAEEVDKDEEILTTAQSQLDVLEPLLKQDAQGHYIVDDEALMRKQYETVFLQEAYKNGEKLDNYELQSKINEAVEELKDKNVLNIYADNLRNKLEKIVDNSNAEKNKIIQKRTEAAEQIKTKQKKELQSNLVKFHGLESFYGVNLDKKTVGEAYVSASDGSFIQALQSDPKLLAEVALMVKVKEQIFKKSSGRTYNDGVESILNEFNKKKESEKDETIIKAQKLGTMATDTQKGLIDQILFEAPKDEAKEK